MDGYVLQIYGNLHLISSIMHKVGESVSTAYLRET
jgi:hypothetical protein